MARRTPGRVILRSHDVTAHQLTKIMSDRYLPDQEVVSTKLDDEAVLLHLKTKRYYSVNATGARIWDHLVDGKSVEEITASITEEFDVETDEAKKEVRSFLAELSEEGLVKHERGG